MCRVAPLLAAVSALGAACASRPRAAGGLYLGPLPCDRPRAAPARVRPAAAVDPALAPGRGAWVVRFLDSAADTALRSPGAARARRRADTLRLRPGPDGAWHLDSARAGRYTLEARLIGWARGPVRVRVRAGRRDTVAVPLGREVPCLQAARPAGCAVDDIGNGVV